MFNVFYIQFGNVAGQSLGKIVIICLYMIFFAKKKERVRNHRHFLQIFSTTK